jgi:hypothetical protein
MPITKLHSVPAFYDMAEAPRPIPVLSSQTEMFYPPTSRISVAATEDMVMHLPPTAPPVSHATSPGPQARRPSQLKLTKTVVFSASSSPGGSSDIQRSAHSPSPSESTLSSLESECGDSGKIPKPNGEAGRPGRGGYNLEEQLGWGEAGFKELKVVQ